MIDLKEINSDDVFQTIIYPTSGRKTSFFVTCGIPGTGKSTYCRLLRNKFVEGDCKIINRDEIRGNLLWELRKEESEIQKEKIKKLDKLVSKKVIEEIINCLNEKKYFGIIIDGCHTEWKTLARLLKFLNTIENSIINLLIVGYYNSPCNYKTSNKKEGDYSDYDENFNHNTIPLEVLTRKRDEMKFLFLHFFEFMIPNIDYVFVLPNREPQK